MEAYIAVGGTIFLSTPSARRATFASTLFPEGVVFLSTPSARRATVSILCRIRIFFYFYPRPPRGGRLQRTA